MPSAKKVEGVDGGEIQKKPKGHLGMIYVFIALLVLMFSQVYTDGKTCKAAHFRYMQLTVSQS